jgi:DNA-binding NarL/FixJ family response regulator
MFGGWGFDDLPMIGELTMTGLIQLGLGLPLIRNGRAAEAVVEIDKALAALSIDDPTGFTGLGYAAAATAAVLAGDEQRGLRLLDRARSTPLRMSRSVEPEIENLLLWPEFFRGGLDHVTAICRRLVDEYERRGLHACELAIRHTAMRLGAPGLQPRDELFDRIDTPAARAMATQFGGLARRDPERLLDAAEQFEHFGERVVAAEAAAQAHHLARSSGQRPLARTAALRVRALTDGIDISPYPLLHDWSAPEPLTPREREVATLAAQQLSNREIARRLRASQRTVEAHLHRAYSKLGVADRRELRRRLHDPA